MAGVESASWKAVSVFLYSGVFYQCHLKLMWKLRSIGYRGHGIITLWIRIDVKTLRTVGLNIDLENH